MLTVRERLKRRRGKVDPIWTYLGVGPGKSEPEPKPDRKYYYQIRQNFRRRRNRYAEFADFENCDDFLFSVARVTLEHDSWLFQRRHLSALMWVFRSASDLFKACPYPGTLSMLVMAEPYESHDLYFRADAAPTRPSGSPPPMTSLPPFLAARISLDHYQVIRYKDRYRGHCYDISRKRAPPGTAESQPQA